MAHVIVKSALAAPASRADLTGTNVRPDNPMITMETPR
jgi:hypothetical protein